jgi:Putative zinc-finger/Predicted integral membrane protein (DUF2275)
MKNCKEIENNLSLYLDNLLSREKKQSVEEHLKSCSQCTRALADLQKVKTMSRELSEIEPPPWFQKKIMAKVREEAERKSLAQKWFYPLRIKIPVQVFATIFIVVIAVYIYRSGHEQFKTVMPSQVPAPVVEAQKDVVPQQIEKATEAVPATVMKAKVADRKDTRDEKVVMYDASTSAAVPKAQEPKKAIPQENISARAADMAKATKEDVSTDKGRAKMVSLPAKQAELEQVAAPPSAAIERKKEGYTLGAAMKTSRAQEVKSVITKVTLTMRVANIDTGTGEVDQLLKKYEAKNIVKQTSAGKVIISAELPAQSMKDFVAQLKTIGRVEEKELPVISNENNILVAIEVINN